MYDLSQWIVNPSVDLLPSPNWTCSFLFIILVFRFLKVFSYNEVPVITVNTEPSKKKTDEICMKDVLNECPILRERYNPPSIWGRNGHLQTAVYGVLGHTSLKRTFDQRHQVKLADGTTVTFDVFEPSIEHPSGNDYTLALCPGICNSSESNYIRTCVHNAQENGFRCVVLNHLGALANIPLTSSRIFSYGNTEELEAMMDKMMDLYPETKFISVGFSMGANLTTLYLYRIPAEKRERIIIGLSVCQGYDAEASGPLFHDWENGRRVYNYIISENVKRLLRRNYEMAVLPHVRSSLINEQRLFAATSMLGVDEQYSRRVQGYSSVQEMYETCSSLKKLPDIKIPMVFMNAADDPLFPEPLFRPVQELCRTHDKHAFVLLKHGGHLGFLEGWSLKPYSVTWLDKFIVQLANSAVHAHEATL